VPDIPFKSDEKALAASKPTPPGKHPPPAEPERKNSAPASLPEESEKPAQADTASPPVTPPAPPPPAPPAEVPARVEKLSEIEPTVNRAETGRSVVSFLISALIHAGLMIVLALFVAATQSSGSRGNLLTLSTSVDDSDLETERIISEVRLPNTVRRHDTHLPAPPAQVPDVNPIPELPPSEKPSMQIGSANVWPDEWGTRIKTTGGGGLEGRRNRAGLAGDGPSDESEEAVERGLWWLVAHQREDGSWNFDHQEGNCRGLCRNPGTNTSTTAATAIALAPFLGAGYTHQDGQHKETVRRGLYYLQTHALQTPNGIDLREGTMYAQGLATIVLCEAFAMTGDQVFKPVAQGALDFIEYAQHKEGGGWRYEPQEPGDTTVTGWQLMALKSGAMADLHVKSPTMYFVNNFLDSVESEEGAKYGYQDSQPRPATTAIGLLCRMYLGWPHTHPGLTAGVRYLDETGPSENDMYYNYYATQVMHHWQGSAWKRWNDRMRDYLVRTQVTRGHEAGSWFFEHTHSPAGGRLYNTAMAIMTLEVYYRYMPLYRDSWDDQQ
jgi:hypothetical protein